MLLPCQASRSHLWSKTAESQLTSSGEIWLQFAQLSFLPRYFSYSQLSLSCELPIFLAFSLELLGKESKISFYYREGTTWKTKMAQFSENCIFFLQFWCLWLSKMTSNFCFYPRCHFVYVCIMVLLVPSSSALIPMSICTLQCLFSHSFTTYEWLNRHCDVQIYIGITSRWTGYWALGLLGIGHLGTWALGHLGTWALGHLGTWALGHLGHLGTWAN
jgi:hypothetical protein